MFGDALRLKAVEETAPEQVIMTPAQWAEIPDNPRQRNTERHLARAAHLRQPSPTHRFVQMATTRAGDRWKLDGHTRALLWQRVPELAPANIVVQCFEVNNEEQAAELYTHFDSRVAVETSVDMCAGALRQAGISPKSDVLRRGKFASAMVIAECARRKVINNRFVGDADIYSVVRDWRNELLQFDEIMPAFRAFPSGLISAALITLRKRGTAAREFWRRYQEDKGVKTETEFDGVTALSRITKSDETKSGMVNMLRLTGRGISSCESYLSGHMYKVGSGPKTTDITKYL